MLRNVIEFLDDNKNWSLFRCKYTTATHKLIPGKMYNYSEAIRAGHCDHGPLQFNVTKSEDGQPQV